MDLRPLGWSEFFAEAFQPYLEAGLEPARVAVEHRGRYELYADRGEMAGEISGRFRHETVRTGDFPAVGDWVVVQAMPGEAKGVIQAVLPRRTKFSRTAAGEAGEEQVLAANVDRVFIVSSLNIELNLRRIERYLTLAWDSGAQPVIVLTKADLCADLEGVTAEVRAMSCGAPVHALSSVTGQGVDQLSPYLRPGQTIALLGSSGVGKSTLINHLLGETTQAVREIRVWDDKGRHTTTRRELICLPSGGLVIDTPGLRELQLWEGGGGLGETFKDIDALAGRCRFSDCQHQAEPGCAVLAAIGSGELDPARLESHRKLKAELRYFERRHDARAQAEDRRRIKSLHKQFKSHPKFNR